VSLADGSMAKLAATSAAQAAVARATQVVGVDSFRRGHVVERLTQDVRAIELFAGRTEALRESVGDAALPEVSGQQAAGSRQRAAGNLAARNRELAACCLLPAAYCFSNSIVRAGAISKRSPTIP